MPAPRRLWDSCVILDYLAGTPGVADACSRIIEQGERGEIEIVVSMLATVEVAYLEGYDDHESESRIREFLGRDYVILAAIDVGIATLARELIRKYKDGPKLRPADATHLSTAVRLNIPVLETTDSDLLKLSHLEGDPPITIRRPLFEGPVKMPGL